MLFVRGGGVDPGYGLGGAGYGGNYWSSVGNTSAFAYNLYFVSGGVNPSYVNYWYGGFSLRCVALGG